MASITSFEIKYETAPNVSPPYCYYYHIRGQVTASGLEIDFEWVYHNREEFTQEDLEDEGFTGQDGFSWQGSIAGIWLTPLEKLLRRTRPVPPSDDETVPFFEIGVEAQSGQGFQGSPDSIPEWEYFMQEFVQSIYETSGKEAPLLIRYKKITDEITLYCSVRMLFKDRQVTLQTRRGDAKLQQKTGNWEEMKRGMEQIFALDYISEKAETREPHYPGTYIDIGENTWYTFGETVLNPSAKAKNLAAIEQFFDKQI